MLGAPCREDLRLASVWDENQREVQLLTNVVQLSAATISAIYKERWQIELFFKALKQSLKIKTFVGTSANAVRTQIWTALIAMLLIKILQQRTTFRWALSNLIALLRWNSSATAAYGSGLIDPSIPRLKRRPTSLSSLIWTASRNPHSQQPLTSS
jgi:hypothetical protein